MSVRQYRPLDANRRANVPVGAPQVVEDTPSAALITRVARKPIYHQEVADPIFTAKFSKPDYLTTSADKPYSFRNLFRVKGNKLGIPAPIRQLEPTDPGESIFLASPTGGDIKEDHDVVLSGSAYNSFDAALHAGRRWRQITQSTFARIGLSCDFGDDDDNNLAPAHVTQPLHITGMFGLTPTDRIFDDRIGLLVFDANPVPNFIFLYGGRPIVSLSPPDPALISVARQRNSGDWPDELRLAYKLVHSAMSDSNAETRFILMVTAIEALIPYRKKESELSRMLEALRPVADGMTSFDGDTRKVVDGLLKSSQYNSIRQYGLKLARRLPGNYGGITAAEYYDEVYRTRSALAHGNLRDIPSLSEDALTAQFSELKRFVLDILESWTEDPSFGDDVT
jgi:hypothetical protein